MSDSLLRVKNMCWADGRFHPLAGHGRAADAVALDRVLGRFAYAAPGADGNVTLARDRLGLNKLFVALDDSGTPVAANYLIDIVGRGVPFERIFSIPAGHVVCLDDCGDLVSLSPYVSDGFATGTPSGEIEPIAAAIRTALEQWFSRFAAAFASCRVVICLSGGLDSGIIAALARQHFPDLTAYTFAFSGTGTSTTEDAAAAAQLADALRIPLRMVPASADDIMAAVESAVCFGQDWRDFNVHCAIVNEILARAIACDAETAGTNAPTIVFTGDLANELLADYTAITYAGRTFYALPNVGPDRLRAALVRGLDAGDREVGIFSRHGLDVIQPYGLLIDLYMRLPGSAIAQDGFKQALARRVAGDLLPAFVFGRRKVRAQIGGATPVGILPVLLANGCDQGWLRRAFCRIFGIGDERVLDRFIRAGRYRVVSRQPHSRFGINAYTVA